LAQKYLTYVVQVKNYQYHPMAPSKFLSSNNQIILILLVDLIEVHPFEELGCSFKPRNLLLELRPLRYLRERL